MRGVFAKACLISGLRFKISLIWSASFAHLASSRACIFMGAHYAKVCLKFAINFKLGLKF